MGLVQFTNGVMVEASAVDPAATVVVSIPAYSATSSSSSLRNESGNAISLWSETTILWWYVIEWPYETEEEFDFDSTDLQDWRSLFERLSERGFIHSAKRYAEIGLDPDHKVNKVYGVVALLTAQSAVTLSIPNHVVSGEYLGLVPRAMSLLVNPVSAVVQPGEQILIGFGLFTTASAEPRSTIDVRFS